MLNNERVPNIVQCDSRVYGRESEEPSDQLRRVRTKKKRRRKLIGQRRETHQTTSFSINRHTEKKKKIPEWVSSFLPRFRLVCPFPPLLPSSKLHTVHTTSFLGKIEGGHLPTLDPPLNVSFPGDYKCRT